MDIVVINNDNFVATPSKTVVQYSQTTAKIYLVYVNLTL